MQAVRELGKIGLVCTLAHHLLDLGPQGLILPVAKEGVYPCITGKNLLPGGTVLTVFQENCLISLLGFPERLFCRIGLRCSHQHPGLLHKRKASPGSGQFPFQKQVFRRVLIDFLRFQQSQGGIVLHFRLLVVPGLVCAVTFGFVVLSPHHKREKDKEHGQ